ncbi:RNA-binding (RRM/RBD/RNP motifs) family protein [Striga asiatica]|uniref:RNA-binding (RRM/RBD/RNP motifs) family protein n=1 Tax=Striga asiatica TaxID=4170 RepID=A0A5A7Q743_STRAF|nr:RNA-binding (RRM/RBD/RNP motifs) family protein [Striga asiatica]
MDGERTPARLLVDRGSTAATLDGAGFNATGRWSKETTAGGRLPKDGRSGKRRMATWPDEGRMKAAAVSFGKNRVAKMVAWCRVEQVVGYVRSPTASRSSVEGGVLGLEMVVAQTAYVLFGLGQFFSPGPEVSSLLYLLLRTRSPAPARVGLRGHVKALAYSNQEEDKTLSDSAGKEKENGKGAAMTACTVCMAMAHEPEGKIAKDQTLANDRTYLNSLTPVHEGLARG